MRRILNAALLALLVFVPFAAAATALGQTSTTPTAIAPSGNLWTGYYYNNQDWSGTPVQTEQSEYVAFNWGYGSPGPAVPVDYFTARYEADVYFYAGTYQFSATADDEVTLIVGGITYVDTRNQSQSGKTQVVQIAFPASGVQHVTVYYREYTETAYVYVDWDYLKDGPGTGPPPISPPAPTPVPNQCGPQSATSVQTDFGDYTPCIQQGLAQSACFQSNGAWNAPNMGSIQNEPTIQIWGNCEPDSVTSFQMSCNSEDSPEEFKCSKTGAGWFPN